MAWLIKKILQNRPTGEMCLSSFKTSHRLKSVFEKLDCSIANVRKFQTDRSFMDPRRVYCASPGKSWKNTKVQGQVSDFCERSYGTRSNTTLMSQQAANQFVRWLLPGERTSLYEALREFELEEGALDSKIGIDKDPTFKQLKIVFICNAIPFIGFGFLDNGIMILAGEYIDHTIGITLGISTMAAAAVGNLISDLMGLGLAGYIEAIAIRLGFEVPPMSTRQASMWKTKYSAYFGRGFGIAIGCILGMFPLLLIDEDKSKELLHSNEENVAGGLAADGQNIENNSRTLDT